MPEEGVTAGSPNQATVAITDDDTSGIVFAPTRLRVTEEATSSSYTVELRSQPTANVTVTISGHNGTAPVPVGLQPEAGIPSLSPPPTGTPNRP